MPSRPPDHSAAVRALRAAAIICAVAVPSVLFANTLHTPSFQLVGHDGVDRQALRRIGNRAESDLALVSEYLDGAAGASIRVHVYPTIESKGLATGYTLPVHVFAAARDVHVAMEAGFDGALSLELSRLAARDRLGAPRVDALETGLAALFVDDWRGRGPLYWAGRLAELEDLHDVARIVDNRWLHGQSDLVMTPVAAAFASFLLANWGKEHFLSRYATWAPSPEEADSLTAPFGDYMRRLRSRFDDDARSVSVPAFQRGFCYANEGYRIHDGYGSRKSDLALKKLASLGTNAVSITPFTYMRAANRPAPLPFSSGAGSENDESVIHAALAARALGMTVMLKPHIWMRGSWPGEIEMTSGRDWDAFFEHYYRWIRHYALMAEMYDMEILCVGVELSKTTGSQVDRWSELIAKLRTVFRGRLTYAANWGGEFESTTIWRDLDYAGVNCYYPLSAADDASDAQLLDGAIAAFDRIEAVAKRWDRPVIITEVGFTSTPAPWVAPYRRARGAETDASAQARCYEAFFRGLVGRSRCAGLYWWKWPNSLEYGGPRHPGFTPNNKPAEKVVERWYGEVLAD